MEKIEKDCTHLLALEASSFITAIYRELLEREPDNEGFADMMRNLYQGMPKEAAVFQIASSVEFAERFKIKNLSNYKKINKKYNIKNKLKKIPVISWFIRFCKLPEMLYNFRMMEVDLVIRERNLQRRFEEVHEKFNYINNLYNQSKQALENVSGKVDTANFGLEYIKQTTDNISGKVDTANYGLEYIKQTSENISGKVDTVNFGLEYIKQTSENISEKVNVIDNKVVIILEQVNNIPKNKEVFRKFELVNNHLNINRLTSRFIFPEKNIISIQAELLTFLSNKQNEFDIYNYLPIEELINYAEGKTIVAAHYSNIIINCALDKNISDIYPAGIEPALLPDICKDKDTLIIANPALSALVISSPLLLNEISNKINRNLVLVIRAIPNQIEVIWDDFFELEFENEKDEFRWANGKKNIWSIKILNACGKPIEVNLNWFSESISNDGELIANCNGIKIKLELKKSMFFSMNVKLETGINELLFEYFGIKKIPSINDNRILAFRIINFSCIYKGLNLYSNFEHQGENIIISDSFIRNKLHRNGFYDVESIAYANHGMSKRELVKTRYEYPGNYSVAGSNKKDLIEFNEVVCYRACRLRKTDRL